MRPTLKDVAKLAGVNFTLVSKYLNGSSQARMTAETKQRIDRALEELAYRPSTAARTLRSGRSRSIGLVLGNLTNAYFAHIADLLLRKLQERSYQLLIALASEGSGTEATLDLASRGVDGIISLFDSLDDSSFLAHPSCPVVVSDRHCPPLSEVNLELAPALNELMRELRTAGIGGVRGLFFPNSLWPEAFQDAAATAGLHAELQLLSFREAERRDQLRGVLAATPEAIFTNGWQTAAMLLDELNGRTDAAPPPKLLFHANCTGPFLADARISGVIASSASQLVAALVDTLLEQVETPGAPTTGRRLPATYLAAGTPAFRRLQTPGFRLT